MSGWCKTVIRPVKWNSSNHFFGAASEAMRRILIDRARHKKSLQQGGKRERVELDQCEAQDAALLSDSATDLLDLNEALAEFEIEEPQKAELVKLRYFAGLSLEQSAEEMSISPATAKRYWAYSRAWLYGRINRK